MSRSVHWQCQFKTINGKSAVVSIYRDLNPITPFQVLGTSDPITTSMDDSDDIFTPVRRSTGYLRLVDDGSLSHLIPTGAKDRYVTLTIDSALMWQGYLKPETYKNSWDYEPTVEIPLQSGLAVLGDLQLLQQDVTLSTGDTMPVTYATVRIARLILECIHLMGTNISRVEFPATITTSDGWGAMGYRLSRYNYFKRNNDTDHSDPDWKPIESVSALDMLSDICTFFGWTAVEHKDALLFVEAGCEDYVTADLVDFVSYALELDTPDLSPVTLQDLELDDYELAGAKNTVEHLQGARKVTVEASSTEVSDVISINEGDLDMFYFYVGGLLDWRYYIKAYTSATPLLETHIYQPDGGTWEEVEPTQSNYLKSAGAMVASYDRVLVDDTDKENFDFSPGLYLQKKADDDGSWVAPTAQEAEDMPAVVFHIPGAAACLYDGAFCISATAKSMKKSSNSGTLNGKGLVKAQLKCGDLYWSGLGWTSTPSYFSIAILKSDGSDGTDGDGSVVDTKGILTNCESCSGQILTIDGLIDDPEPLATPLDGDVTLTIPTLVQTDTSGGSGDYDDLVLYNFRVEYKAPVTRFLIDDSTRRYSAFTGIDGDDISVSTDIASADRTRPGYGILRDASKADVTSVTYADGATERPEQHLVGRMADHYGAVRDKITVDVDVFGIVPGNDSPEHTIEHDEKVFAICGRSVNWQAWTQTLTLVEI